MNLEQLEQPEGNTKVPAVPPKKARAWSITYNNPVETVEQFHKVIEASGAIKWIFQLEKAPTTGTPHYQIGVYYQNPRVWPQEDFPGCHIEYRKSWKAVVKYCSKVASRVAGPWGHGVPIPKPLKLITTFYPWQQRLYDLLKEEADDRKVLWLWEAKGCAGKTQFAKRFCNDFPMSIYVGSGSSADVKYAIAAMLEDGRPPEVVFYGVPRDGNDPSFELLEVLKDGFFFSSKYESGMISFNPPHVVIFANRPPLSTSGLSEDRWQIECIDDWMGGVPPPLAHIALTGGGLPPSQGGASGPSESVELN